MIKKLVAFLMCFIFNISIITAFAVEGENIVLSAAEADYNKDVSIGAVAKGFSAGKYLGFSDVDLTGMRSVELTGMYKSTEHTNGDTVKILIDDPVKGTQIGSIVIWEDGTSFSAPIEFTRGVHNIYFVSTYANSVADNYTVSSYTLKKEEYVDNAMAEQVPDSAVKDFYSDTWVSTDSFGRKVADYAEAGAVKGDRTVAMMYWNWLAGEGDNDVKIISDIIKKYPDAMNDSLSDAWKGYTTYMWDEPAMGFYSSSDYWVVRQHMELLATAGVDVVFLDLTNSGWYYPKALGTIVTAMRDAKKAGVKAPKLAVDVSKSGDPAQRYRLLSSLYNIAFVLNDWSDIWYHLDSKPLIMGYESAANAALSLDVDDKSGRELVQQITNSFTWREEDNSRNKKTTWTWLEGFPQSLERGKKTTDGRPEFMALGVAMNESYIDEGVAYAFSEPYAKSRSYSHVFGKDYSDNAARKAYFFREEANQVLEGDPHIVYIDGWNEFTANRQSNFFGLTNVFVDTFNADNSRDIEPVKGLLKDDYYNLITDFVRKYKGVRPAPAAGDKKTITVGGDVSQWESVTPEYLNYEGIDRDSKSGYKNPETGKVWEYKTESSSRVVYSKVARDDNNIYFMAKTKEGKSVASTALYINSDRNPATGFSGYDIAIGKNGDSTVYKLAQDGTAETINNAAVVRNGNMIEISVPREVIGQTDEVNFEFKWVNGDFSDVIELYEKANSAPIGRFNYLYTETEEKTLTTQQRATAKDASVLKAGAGKMIVSGAIETVYEKDTSKTAFEMNGTLYVPMETFEELLGYGEGKTEYNYLSNLFYFYNYKMNEERTKVTEENWYYTAIGSYEGRANGRLKALSAPVVVSDSIIWVPVSLLSECAGMSVSSLGNGVYTIGAITAENASALVGYIS